MKLNIALSLVQIDPGFIKGEELDQEVISQIENLELDGWEVSSVDIQRSAKKVAVDSLLRDNVKLALHYLQESDFDLPSSVDPKYTWRELTLWVLRTGLTPS